MDISPEQIAIGAHWYEQKGGILALTLLGIWIVTCVGWYLSEKRWHDRLKECNETWSKAVENMQTQWGARC